MRNVLFHPRGVGDGELFEILRFLVRGHWQCPEVTRIQEDGLIDVLIPLAIVDGIFSHVLKLTVFKLLLQSVHLLT